MSGQDVYAASVAEAEPSPDRHGANAAERVRRAARLDCTPATLHELAQDPDIVVRAAVAMNERCDASTDALLAIDDDERVRALLGARIARLLTGLDPAEQASAIERVHTVLRGLALDQAVRVRAAVADAIAATELAPHDLIVRLANDVATEVNDRVIRLSPLLSDADLLAVLAQPPTETAARAIASRERLSAVVADAIVQNADAPTIRALLSNESACIRESTLDALVGRAPDHVDWHAPLVRRPLLSTHAIRALSEFITADLLRLLAKRTDLDPDKLDIVRRRLSASQSDDQPLLAAARALQASGKLTEADLLETARLGDTRQLLAKLAVSSGVPLRRVTHVLEMRSVKALVSLVWASGLSMALAVELQMLLSQFGPDNRLLATSTGGFPLTEDQMVWQIELLRGHEPG